MADWPPNTVDSGYVPSPCSADAYFSYSSDDVQEFSSSTLKYSESSSLRLSKEVESYDGSCATEEGGLMQKRGDFSKTPDGEVEGSLTVGSRDPKVTPILSKLLQSSRKIQATPPINIPKANLQSLFNYEHSMCQNFSQDSSDPAENEYPQEPPRNVADGSNFCRPRSNSCPEISRPTPPRPPIPLYSTPSPDGPYDPLLIRKALSEPTRKQFTSGHFQTAPVNVSHSRHWSTPVETPGHQEEDPPAILLPPTSNPGHHRDAVKDLSADGGSGETLNAG